jgi:hypothetical protein
MPLDKVECSKIYAHRGSVNCLAVTDTGTVASFGSEGVLKFSRRQDGKYVPDGEAREAVMAVAACPKTGDVLAATNRGVRVFPHRAGRPGSTLVPNLAGLTSIAAASRGECLVMGDDEGRLHLYAWSRRLAVGSALPLDQLAQVDVDDGGRILAVDVEGRVDIYHGKRGEKQAVDRVADKGWSRGRPTTGVLTDFGAAIGTSAGAIVWLGEKVPRPALTAPRAAVLVRPGGRSALGYQIACVGGHGEAAAILANEAGPVSSMVHLGGGAVAGVLGGRVLVVTPSGEWTELYASRGEEFVSVAASARAGLLAAGGDGGTVYAWGIGPGSPIGGLLHGGG